MAEGTLRERVRAALAERSRTVRELSQALSATEREVEAALPHVERSVKASGGRFMVSPPECAACGYAFEERTRAKKPSRCPACRATRVKPASFRATEKSKRGEAEEPAAAPSSAKEVAMSEELRLDTIGQISIPVKDVPRAVAFYRDTLGMKLLFEFPGLGFFDCGGVRLMLSRAEAGEHDHPASILYYKVPDLRAAAAVLKARGADLVDEPHLVAKLPDHELWMFFLRDGEGNTLALMSEVR